MGRSGTPRIGTIDNTGPNTLAAFLLERGPGCDRIDLAVAFVTASGLEQVLHLLKLVAAKGRVRILTGLYQGFTDPKALRTLLREQRDTADRLSARVSTDAHFHWKAYLLAKRAAATVVVGSSNLTADGLGETGELNLTLLVPAASKAFRDVSRVFDAHWDGRSGPLTARLVEKYTTWREGAGGSPRHRVVPIKALVAGGEEEKPQPVEPRYWRTGVSGHLAEATEDLLARTTDWDRRGYSYFSTGEPTFRPGDRIALFDTTDNFLELVEVVGTTRMPVRTPDGRHFAAYRRLKGVARRKLVPNRWRALKAAGLLARKGDAALTRKLSERTFEAYRDLLGRA